MNIFGREASCNRRRNQQVTGGQVYWAGEVPDMDSKNHFIKKSNDKWRMCIDYSDLNKACPKDYSLSYYSILFRFSTVGLLIFRQDRTNCRSGQYRYDHLGWYPEFDDQTLTILDRLFLIWKYMSFKITNSIYIKEKLQRRYPLSLITQSNKPTYLGTNCTITQPRVSYIAKWKGRSVSRASQTLASSIPDHRPLKSNNDTHF